jgi:hypothetical protein
MHQKANNHGSFSGNAMAALAATVILHSSIIAGVLWGGWLDGAKIFHPLKPKHRLVTVNLAPKPSKKNPAMVNEFVPVRPEARTKEQPKEKTPYYSNANSIASNLDPHKKAEVTPRINDAVDTALGRSSSPRPPPAVPTITRPRLSRQAIASAKAKPSLLKPSAATFEPAPIVGKQTSPAELSSSIHTKIPPPSSVAIKPNTSLLPDLPENPKAPKLREAKASLGNRGMKKEGGVLRQGPAALDVRLTGYGDYDARFFAAISIAWRKQIKARTWVPSQVIVDFSLFHDGRIEDLSVRETKAAAILQYFCREAIQQPAPFEPWTESMRQQLGNGPRRCRITFNYLVR